MGRSRGHDQGMLRSFAKQSANEGIAQGTIVGRLRPDLGLSLFAQPKASQSEQDRDDVNSIAEYFLTRVFFVFRLLD